MMDHHKRTMLVWIGVGVSAAVIVVARVATFHLTMPATSPLETGRAILSELPLRSRETSPSVHPTHDEIATLKERLEQQPPTP